MADDNTTIDSTPDSGGSPGEPSLRDDIASAFDTVESTPTPGAPGGNGADTTPLPTTGAPPAAGRVRDPATGKFTSAPEAPAPASAKAPAPLGKPEAAPAPKQPLATPQKPPEGVKPDAAAAPPQVLKAPASWPPAAREHWAKLPPEVQQVVARRESEVGRTLQESAKAREALTHVQQVISPFAQNFAAAGKDALGAMQELFQADNTLRHGSVAEKAHMAANIIKSYGIDIRALDSILAGQQAEVDPAAALTDKLRKEMQQQLQPVLGYFNQMQGRRQAAMQQINADAGTEVETFAGSGEAEFFEDVRQDMADIIDLYTARGHSITLQDAYERAIRVNPQVSEIISKRAEAERVNAAAAAAQRARRTAASIGGSAAPAGAGPGPAGDSRRAEIEAAWDQSSGG